MRISVVITCYNLEKYIHDAIASVLSQTRQPDEIIVVDDCSIDNSAKVIHSFGSKVTYLKMPQNSGVLLSTLSGIRASKGEIISFLDGDDIWLPHKLEAVMDVFEREPDVILLSHNYEIIDGEGKRNGKVDSTHLNLKRITRDNPTIQTLSSRLKDSILGYKGVWLGSAYCFRRQSFNIDAFEQYLRSFSMPNFMQLCYQDHPIAQFIILTNSHEKLVFLIDKVLFQYRVFGLNSSGVSNTVESAIRTIRKGQANILATSTLLASYPSLVDAARRQELMKLEFDYLFALYTGNYRLAIMKFFQLNKQAWGGRKRVKELKRTIGVLLLGPDKFLAIKSKH